MSPFIIHALLILSSYISFLCYDYMKSPSQVLFDEDGKARQAFNPQRISPGLLNLKLSESYSHDRPVNAICDALLACLDPPSYCHIPSSTAWKYSEVPVWHENGRTTAYAFSLSYLYKNSTGLMPIHTNLFPREHKQGRYVRDSKVKNSHPWKFPVCLVMQKAHNGSFVFPSPC